MGQTLSIKRRSSGARRRIGDFLFLNFSEIRGSSKSCGEFAAMQFFSLSSWRGIDAFLMIGYYHWISFGRKLSS